MSWSPNSIPVNTDGPGEFRCPRCRARCTESPTCVGGHGEGTSEWMVSHLQRMIAVFISTVSAVSAVNLTPVLGIWAWLWPTVVGVPLIIYWSSTYSTG